MNFEPSLSRFSTSESVIVLITCSSCTSEEDTDVIGENWGVSMVLLQKDLSVQLAEENDVSSELLPDDSSLS